MTLFAERRRFHDPTGRSDLDVALTFQSGPGGWSMTLFGTNPADARYITNGLDGRASIDLADVTVGRPRE